MVAAITLLAGCSSSPAPVLFTIAPVDGPTYTASPPVVLVEQIGLARYLERTRIVRSSDNYHLKVMSNDWWGEPPAAMLNRVLVSELGQRLPHSVVISESGAISAPADATVSVNISRLDANASGLVVVQAQAAVTVGKQSGRPLLRDLRFAVAPNGTDTAAQVAAISTGVGHVADAIAAMLATGKVP